VAISSTVVSGSHGEVVSADEPEYAEAE